MEILHFATEHADKLGWLAMIASLLFTALELRHANKAQQVRNLIAINGHHWELWSQLFQYPELQRVLSPNPDLEHEPVTEAEARFVTFIILHLNTSRKAERAKLFKQAEGLDLDVRGFFSLPIPKAVWLKASLLQDRDLVAFVDRALWKAKGAGKDGQFGC